MKLDKKQINNMIIGLFSAGAELSFAQMAKVGSVLWPNSCAEERFAAMSAMQQRLRLVRVQEAVNKVLRSTGLVLKSRDYGEVWYVVTVPAAIKEIARYNRTAETMRKFSSELQAGVKTSQLVLALKTK